MNLYLFAIRENADDEAMATIDRALEPPLSMTRGGVPAWYGSDEDAWESFSYQVR
jgi:hypothetical protein